MVVITRPRDEAAALADELMKRGYRTLIEPMLDIAPLPIAIPPLAKYGALVFTSANGARIFAGRSDERSIPAYAVGGHTARILRDVGFVDVRDASGDAEALVTLIGRTLGNQRPLLHVSGQDVAREIGSLLAPARISVDRLIAYQAIPAAELSQALVAALYARTVRHVLFFSVRTARAFGTLLQKRGLTPMISSSSAVCLSSHVAAEAGKLPWGGVETASEPTAAALTALLPPTGANDAQ
ncbi:MAG: hemD [Rhodospirillales bacterium]|nr:hemD [Rhodospirillales bacterium]